MSVESQASRQVVSLRASHSARYFQQHFCSKSVALSERGGGGGCIGWAFRLNNSHLQQQKGGDILTI